MTAQDHTKTYLFFGDSLIDRKSIVTPNPCYDLPAKGETVTVLDHQTGGFFKLLKEMLQITYPSNKIEFQNHAKGGSTSTDIALKTSSYFEDNNGHATNRKDELMTKTSHEIFICVGTNDASHSFFNLGDRISEEKFKENYDLILKSIYAPHHKIYCILPPPTRVKETSMQINEKIMRYNSAIVDLESVYDGVQIIDLYTPFEDIDTAFESNNPELSLRIEDGVHFSDLGNQLAANIIWDSITSE